PYLFSADGTAVDRGRNKGLTLPLPPNRTGGFPASGFPVSGLMESWPLGFELRLRRLTRMRRNRHLATADDRSRGHARFPCAVCAGCFAASAVSTGPTVQTLSCDCV